MTREEVMAMLNTLTNVNITENENKIEVFYGNMAYNEELAEVEKELKCYANDMNDGFNWTVYYFDGFTVEITVEYML